jgi:hypothetical protein
VLLTVRIRPTSDKSHTCTQVINTWTNDSVKGVPQLPGHHPFRLE